MASLVSYLQNLSAQPGIDSDVNWKRYVYDHRAYLKGKAQVVNISPEIIEQCKYSVRRWMRMASFNPDYWWIVMLINDIDSDLDFCNEKLPTTVVYVPSDSDIADLHLNYITTSTSRITDPIGE